MKTIIVSGPSYSSFKMFTDGIAMTTRGFLGIVYELNTWLWSLFRRRVNVGSIVGRRTLFM